LGGRHLAWDARLKRGEIWTASGDGGYAAKPRPVVIIQHDHFSALESVTVCGFTSDPTDLPLFRIVVEPSTQNGLQSRSRIMVDKILTIRKNRLGYQIGRLAEQDIKRLGRAIATFLALSD
jgi:mRNA interferase MazF